MRNPWMLLTSMIVLFGLMVGTNLLSGPIIGGFFLIVLVINIVLFVKSCHVRTNDKYDWK